MPRRLLLDGDDLPALMQRVRTEMGPDAVVVKAERVRTGGVAGFFAKERFEVTVEVPDRRPGPVPRPTAAPGPVGLSALLDAADAADGAGSRAGVPDGGLPGRAPSPPRVSTDGDTFASLLASIDDMADVHPAGAAGSHAGAHAGSHGATSGGAPGSAAPAPGTDRAVGAGSPGSPDEPASSPKPPAARFAPQGATVTAAAFAPLGPATPPDEPPTGGFPQLTAAPAPPALPAGGTPSAVPVLAPVGAPGRSTSSGTSPDAGEAPGGAGPTATSAGGSSRRALVRLGVPASLLGTGPLDEPLPLSRLLGALPRPPAALRTPGTLVAVVGEGSGALAVATGLAQRARLDPRDVVLAGDIAPVQGHGRRLLNPAAAARHRAKVTGAETVSVVVVGVGPEVEDWAAAAALLAELAPDQSWGVVDARRKTADLRAWLHAVAGPRPFDVVAASWVHETQEPGTVLDLGAPVGWLDGLPATPVVWAAVLSERLDAGARWD